jgi:hypothetical protein
VEAAARRAAGVSHARWLQQFVAGQRSDRDRTVDLCRTVNNIYLSSVDDHHHST